MRKRPEIPEDVFFDNSAAREAEQAEAAEEQAPETEPESEEQPAPRKKRSGPRSYTRVADERTSAPARVGRPPAQEGPKIAVTLYLTEPVAHMLEEVRFLLLTEHGVRTSKSAIADYALRNGLDDLAAAAEDLRRE